MKTGLFTASANEAAEVVKTSLFTTSANEAAEVVKTSLVTTLHSVKFFRVGEEVYLDSGTHCRAGVAWDRFRWNSYWDRLLLDGTSFVFPLGLK